MTNPSQSPYNTSIPFGEVPVTVAPPDVWGDIAANSVVGDSHQRRPQGKTQKLPSMPKVVLKDGRDVASFTADEKSVFQIAIDHGLPVGPIEGDQHKLLAAVKKSTTNGGGHGVRFGGDRPANTTRGPRKRIHCDQYDKETS